MQLGPSETTNPPSIIEQPDVETPVESTETTTQAATGEGAETATQRDPVAIERLLNRLQSGESLLPNVLLIGGILMMVIIMMRLLRKNMKKDRRRANALRSPTKRIDEHHASAQATMDPSYKVMVDAEEMARRLGAVMDNKAARLELLIEEADKKLAEFNRTLVSSSITQSSAPDSSDASAPARSIDPTLLDRARVEQDLEDRQSRVAGRIEPKATETTPPVSEPQSVQEKVIDLADAGISNIEIAHQLNQPIGQIELILNLRKQQG